MNDLTPDVSLASLSAGRAELFARKAGGAGGRLTPEQQAEYAAAARGFEAMFVQMLHKQMKDAMLTEDEDNDGEMLSFGADTLQGYADMQYSDFVSRSGKGIGIADRLYKTLTGGEELPAISQTAVSSRPAFLRQAARTGQTDDDAVEPLHPAPDGRATGNSVAARLQQFEPHIRESAGRNGVPPELIRAVMRAESAGRADAVSPAGAKGLMQLMDGTAAGLGVRNSFDPQQNIEGGAKYLRQMLDMFGGNTELALAAYNAGPGNVRKHDGIPPFAETRQYVNRVMKYLREEQRP